MVELLANSFYLKKAGIDWRLYWAAIEEDLEASSYSQHAAAFALTLLPNVKTFKLPRWWKPIPATGKLLDAVIHITRQPCPLYGRPSIAQVSKFEASVRRTSELRYCHIWIRSSRGRLGKREKAMVFPTVVVWV